MFEIETMQGVELFFTKYEHTAWAFFSFTSFLFIAMRMLDWGLTKHRRHVEERQRMDYQASFFDLQENRFNDLVRMYTKLVNEIAALHKEMYELKRTKHKDRDNV